MKRDMDLIRAIVLEVESDGKPDLSGYTDGQNPNPAAAVVPDAVAAAERRLYLEDGGFRWCRFSSWSKKTVPRNPPLFSYPALQQGVLLAPDSEF